MVLGMTPFTLFHVVLSLIGIVAGFVVLHGWITARRREHWTEVFLTSTAATVITGFMFPITVFTPALGVGIASAIVLAVAIASRYWKHLSGHWRETYIVSGLIALYLNSFVLVVQAFQKVPTLHALAPTGSEQPFALVQGLLLVFFIFAGYLSLRRFPMVHA
jgi:hypothetical protein